MISHNIKTVGWLGLFLLGFVSATAQETTNKTEQILNQMTDEILVNGKVYGNLTELLNNGPRLTGSKKADEAARWAAEKMKSYGFDKVYLQPVMVPKWERGSISKATAIINRKKENLTIVALGLSVGTPKGGVEGEVIEVKQLSELDELGEKLKGKIVFFNRAFDEKLVNTFSAYGGAVDQRSAGPSRAAKYGAIATVVRSMTNRTDHHPHTGVLRYLDGIPKIPASAITTLDADRLSKWLKENKSVRLKIELDCRNFPDVQSYNVVGEITGSELPQEIVLVGGHLDSWDLSPGAHDNGSGCMQSMEVLRTFKALNIHPKRTLRAVLFMSEEVGGIGGIEYAKQAKLKMENHVAAIETDRGGFAPIGFTIQSNDSVFAKITSWKPYFRRLLADDFVKGGGGTDIGPLADQGAVLLGLFPEPQRYFDYHHSNNDNIDAVNPRELKLGAAALTQMIYLLSENGI